MKMESGRAEAPSFFEKNICRVDTVLLIMNPRGRENPG
jgi:hypothetical protein